MSKPESRTVLDVLVNNHPGVMSHVCGLFSRRGFNVEAILCLPVKGEDESRIWLLVNDDERLEQMVRQMRKLQDVHDVKMRPSALRIFAQFGDVMDS